MLEIILMAPVPYQHPPYSYPSCSHVAVPFSFSRVEDGELVLNDGRGACVNFPDKAGTELPCDSNFLAVEDFGFVRPQRCDNFLIRDCVAQIIVGMCKQGGSLWRRAPDEPGSLI